MPSGPVCTAVQLAKPAPEKSSAKIGAAVLTVQVRESGVGSVLPAASVAVTVKVWSPGASPLSVTGDEHGEYGAPSSVQVYPEAGSEAVNSIWPPVAPVSPEGPAVIVVSGAVRSGPPSGILLNQ